jgi:hypothetical protein
MHANVVLNFCLSRTRASPSSESELACESMGCPSGSLSLSPWLVIVTVIVISLSMGCPSELMSFIDLPSFSVIFPSTMIQEISL